MATVLRGITHSRTWLAWLAVCVVAVWALTVVWWLLLEPAQAGNNVEKLVIPEGTAAAVERGEDPPFIPNSLELGRSGKLLVLNNDTEPHRVGARTIPPGDTAEITPVGDDEGQLSCTVHPSGAVAVSIDERPPFWATIAAALGVGLPIGAVFGGAAVVAGRLSMDG